ncbi:carnitinyl-dehydratase [Lasallia pustulata]|uniref:Carnitinyl-dehydratase n=1 Tax=Lasallia pustulata TaxID=136370 RepID=A0A1W5DCV5_9LECA|nr:carnitinyl-dehydratase [Lasallia pustulata]
MAPSFKKTVTPLPAATYALVEIPAPHVLLVTMNLAAQMNALPMKAVWEMDRIWRWFDNEPELRVGIITGAGTKAFSAGMDLKERQKLGETTDYPTTARLNYPSTGFAGLSRRVGRKPIIAACNGHAHGGGFEVVLNSDIVLASPNADFRLPDVLRGTAALAGAFPRLCRTFGLQRANLIALTAYTLSAEEAQQWGLVQRIVPLGDLVLEAVRMAGLIASMSPDSVIVSRAGIREAWKTASVERATQITGDAYADRLMGGENVKEGLLAFGEKREPRWVPSKL